MNTRMTMVGLALCYAAFLGGGCSPSSQKPTDSAAMEAKKKVRVSRRGDRKVLSVSGSGRAWKKIGERYGWVPVDVSDVEAAKNGYVFVFEPVEEVIVDQICGLASVDEVEVWYGSFTPQQRKRISQRFPKCVIHENMNKI